MAIENLKEEIFGCKGQYLAFLQAWKNTANSGKRYYLTGTHYLLYTLLRNRDVRMAFTYPKRESKRGYESAFNQAVRELRNHSRNAAKLVESRETGKNLFGQWLTPERVERSINAFLEPFDGLVTYQMLAKLHELVHFDALSIEPKIEEAA